MSEIKTSFVHPPIPVRHFDWCAIFEGYDMGEFIGWGTTEQEAIDSLLVDQSSRRKAMPKMIDNFTFVHGSFVGLRQECTRLFKLAQQEARASDLPIIRPRIRCLIAVNAQGRLNPPYDEPWTWNGTLKQLRQYAEESRQHGAVEIVVEGGFDGAETFADFDSGNYEPCVTTWETPAVTLNQLVCIQAKTMAEKKARK